MSHLVLLPIKMIGWTAAGVGLAVGWKIGSYVINKAKSNSEVQRFYENLKACCQPAEPLWKRQFSKVSDE
ncbi:MAG: hypothetical protein HY913_23670 [Desulfomonile tiedjei]|nr:hypothetical protein [Desulfomonile tiedjei]